MLSLALIAVNASIALLLGHELRRARRLRRQIERQVVELHDAVDATRRVARQVEATNAELSARALGHAPDTLTVH